MIHNKKQTGIVLFVVLIMSASLLFGRKQYYSSAIANQAFGHTGSGTVKTNGTKKNTQSAVITKKTSQTFVQSDSTASQTQQPPLFTGRLTAYLASQAKGVIGLFDGNKTDNPADNIFSIDLDYEPVANDKVWLTYRLTGVSENCGVACSVNDRLAFGGYLVKQDTATSRQRIQLNTLWLQKGVNRIQFGLPENADYGYRISDLALEVEKNANVEPLTVNTSYHLYNGKAYVHGFLQGTGVSALVNIDGRKIAVHDGEFEALIYPNQQQVEVMAEIAGRTYSHTLHFSTNMIADKEYELIQNPISTTQLFEKGKPNELQIANLSLQTDNKVLIASTPIAITPLRPVDLPALDLDMTNVTAVNYGFRFLPHGEHFTNKGATVALKYDRTKIPDGYTENDIHTYYFDQNTRHWVALERDSVDKSLCMVISQTTHFTDMINGVIKAPESPQTQGFAPTTMNDIKAADPTSKIELIAPPAANNYGSTNLNYNLEMPPARNGMSPQLTITYNSDGGSSWLGEGWDLNIPSVSVDTRWGVPIYHPDLESETYSFSGTQLARTYISPDFTDQVDEEMFLPDRGTMYLRNKPLQNYPNDQYQFYPRVETDFPLITRMGTDIAKYKWKVENKNGIKYYYGYDYANDEPAVLSDGGNKIAEWKLQSMVDIHGDSIAYSYDKAIEDGYEDLKPRAIYLSKIEGFTIVEGVPKKHTEVFLTNRIDPKQKKTNNARYGFLVSSQKLLEKVEIKYANDQGVLEKVRSYVFNYKKGEFLTDLLESVSQLDSADQVVGKHTFGYYDDVSSDNTTDYVTSSYQYNYNSLMNNTESEFQKLMQKVASGTINNCDGIYNPLNKGLLNNTSTTNVGGSLYLGLGLGFKILSRSLTVGVASSYQHTDTKGQTCLIDINGDGIPDNVLKNGNSLYYNQGYLDRDGNVAFSTANKILLGAPQLFLHSTGDNLTLGLMADFKVISGRFDSDLLNISSTDVYFSDVNGDGLVDIVYFGCVYFNRLVNGEPVFNRNSKLSEMPMNNTTLYNTQSATAGLIRYDKGEEIDEPKYQTGNVDIPSVNEMITYDTASDDTIKAEASPLQDMVRIWVAPYTGSVKIYGNIQLLAPTGAYDTLAYQYADGVRVAIQQERNELWWRKIAKTETAPIATFLTTDVQKGDRLFFRVQAGDSLFSNGDFDKVLWAPIVEYTSVPGVERTTDYSDYSNYLYNAREGYVVEDLGYTEIDSGVPVKIAVDVDMSYQTIYDTEWVLAVYSSNYPSQFQDTVINGQTVCNSGYEKLMAIDTMFYFNSHAGYLYNVTHKDKFTINLPGNKHKYFWFKLYGLKNERLENVKIYPTIYCQHTNSSTNTIVYDTICAGVKYPINYDTIQVENPASNLQLSRSWNIENSPECSFCNLFYYQTNNCSNNKFAILKTQIKGDDNYFMSALIVDQEMSIFQSLVQDFNNPHNIVHNNCRSKIYYYDEDGNFTQPNQNIYCTLFQCDDSLGYKQHVIAQLQTDLYKLKEKESSPYGPMWRNWGQFQYNAAERRYAKPIDIDSLLPPIELDSNIVDMDMNRLIRLSPNVQTKQYWAGNTTNVKLFGDTIQAGRQYANNVRTILLPNVAQADPTEENNSQSQQARSSKVRALRSSASSSDVNQYLISAPPILSKQKNSSLSGNVSLNVLPRKLRNKLSKKLNIGVSMGVSSGKTEKKLDYMDFNGDGFPDYFNDGKIYYSNSHGTTASITTTCKDCQINNTEEERQSTLGSNFGVSSGVASLVKNSSTTNESQKAEEESSSISASGSVSNSVESLHISFMDINGDGLPDLINHETGKVSINLGYNFSSPVDLPLYTIRTKTFGANAGLGVGREKWNGSLLIGVGIGVALSSTNNRLIDINGDGLPDIVSLPTASLGMDYNLLHYVPHGDLKVRLNNGNGFEPEQTWNSGLWSEKTIASSLNANAGFTFGFSIWFLKFVTNPSAQAGITNSRGLEDIRDMNADGYPDFVTTDLKNATMTVKYSAINRTNKLKTVSNPLGGRFRVDYMRSAPTIYHPNGKWVMKSLEINDGIGDDGNNLYNEYLFEDGKYNRREREFDGFGKVTTLNIEKIYDDSSAPK